MGKLSAKKILNSNIILNILTVVALAIIAYSLYDFFKPYFAPLKEGAVFTPYDNANYFVRPWDQFCVQNPPSCKKENINYLQVDGNPKIGCWCDEQKAPQLDNNCTDLNFDPFAEYR